MTTERFIFRCTAMLLVLASTGCAFHAYSPPARLVMLDNAQPLEEGRTAVAVEGGPGGFVFSETSGYGTLRVRRGFGHNLEATLDLSAAYVDGGELGCGADELDCVEGRADGFGMIGRVGVKWAPWGKHFALTGGLGGGGSLFGGHLAPDVGFIASYDNRYAIPFFALSFGVSVPIEPRTLQFGPRTDRAETTLVVPLSTGVKVPLGAADASVRGALLGGIGFIVLADADDSEAAVLASLGGEVSF